MKALPGTHETAANEAEFFAAKVGAGIGGLQDQVRKKRVLIYYVGGVTFGEIAAIRFLNKLFKDKKFIIATTQIINGDACVEMLRGPINNKLNLASIL